MSSPTSHPGELLRALLHADIAFFQEGPSLNRPHLVVVDDYSGFCFCLRLANMLTSCVGDGVGQVINEFKSWGHRVVTLRSDYEMLSKAAPPATASTASILSTSTSLSMVSLECFKCDSNLAIMTGRLPSLGLPECWIGPDRLKHVSSLCSLSRAPHPNYPPKEIWAGCRSSTVRRERGHLIGAIVLAVEMRSDAGAEYDYEAIEDLPPALPSPQLPRSDDSRQ
jgi:hypothetical protein